MFQVKAFFFLIFQCLMVFSAVEANIPGLVSTEKCINCFQLNNEQYIPVVGLGTYGIGENESQVIQAIKNGIDAGYRHIDTADIYHNEKGIGKALEEVIKSGKVKRDDLFITTKVWNNQHTEELALASVRRSLKDLKLDYLDLVLVHWPQTFRSGDDYVPKHENGTIIEPDLSKENYELAYKGLEKAFRLNLTRSIGVSNFNVKQLERILSIATVKPVVNQVELNPFLAQEELLTFATLNNIRLVAYSPLRQGDSKLFSNSVLQQIATKYGKTVAQVALRWQLQRGVVIIPKTSKPKRMNENKEVFDFSLTQDEMNSINRLNRNARVIKFEGSSHLTDYPF